MAIVQPQFPSFWPTPSYLAPQAAARSILAPPPPLNLLAILEEALQALSSTSRGWGGFVGPPTPQFNKTPAVYGAAAPIQVQGVTAAMPGGFASASGYGGGGPVSLPPQPGDPQEFASYLQAQRLGGSLQGKTGIAQKDALPGTRFGQEQAANPWQASVARNYAYQFAAYAIGADALTPAGMQQGEAALANMSPDAKLFAQVASVFKGNLLNGPGFYNNPGLKQLLLSKGQTDLASQPGVGETDVQSIGAVVTAMNRGVISLQDVINSGTIDNLNRYQQVINYVQQGGFARDVASYESAPI